jgi:GH35 family endo-1,4-beta-xylanase
MTVDHRSGELALTILDRDRSPLADTVVTVEQTRHAFAFGNIAFELVRLVGGPDPGSDLPSEGRAPDAALDLDTYARMWLGLFDTATLPFYWGRFEPRRGEPDTVRLMRAADWLRARDVRRKGHPLVWHTVQPDWLMGLSLDEVERLLRERVRAIVGGFAGHIDVWDAINEAVIMPVFDNGPNAITPLARARGRIHMVRLAFEEARRADPSATHVLNDFDLSSAYECLIEGVLEAGIRVDAIGLQTHMHQGYRGEEWTMRMLDRFARYGLPLHLTETSLVSGELMPPDIVDLNDSQVAEWPSTPEGEARQADEIVRHYRTLVSHPAVHAITYWGLTDAGAWLGAPVGLVRRDGTPKPAYDALRALIRGEWWLPPTQLRTDPAGRVRVHGFRGDYRVAVAGGSATFAIEAGTPAATVTLGAAV